MRRKIKVTFFPDSESKKAVFIPIEYYKWEVIGDYIIFTDEDEKLEYLFNLTNVRDIKPFIENINNQED